MLKKIVFAFILLSTTLHAQEQTYFEEILLENVLTLINGDTVKLAGVLPHPYSQFKSGDYKSGAEYLESILKGKLFTVSYTEDSTVRFPSVIISVTDSLMVNLKMVADGYALTDLAYSYQFSENFLHAELVARRQLLGLWAMPIGKRIVQPVAEVKEVQPEPEEMPESLGLPADQIKGSVVYVVPDEKYYHRISCARLDGKGQTVSKKEARKFNYRACSRCRPMGD